MPEILDYHYEGSLRDDPRRRMTQFFSSFGRRRTFNLLATIAIAIILPVTFFAVQKSQELRQRANVAGNFDVASVGILSGSEIIKGVDSTTGESYVQFGNARNNKYGIGILVPDSDYPDSFEHPDTQKQLHWAKQLVGVKGYILFFFPVVSDSIAGPLPVMNKAVQWAYDNNLTPVVRLDMDYNQGCHDDAGCDRKSEAVKRIVSGLPKRNDTPLWIEIDNEVNFYDEWQDKSPAHYGLYLLKSANKLHSLNDPRIKVMNAGLAPDWGVADSGSGAVGKKATTFIREMLDANPELKTGNAGGPVIDAWAAHAYPNVSTPNINTHSGAGLNVPTYDSYINELNVLASYGITSLPVFLTETGYESPPFNQTDRASHMVEALNYLMADSRVMAFTPFILSDFIISSGGHGKWFGNYMFVPYDSGENADGTPTNPYPIYTTMRNKRISDGF